MKKLLLFSLLMTNITLLSMTAYDIIVRNTTKERVYVRLENPVRGYAKPSPKNGWVEPGQSKTFDSGADAHIDVYFDFPNPEHNPTGHAVADRCGRKFKIFYPDQHGKYNWDEDWKRGVCE